MKELTNHMRRQFPKESPFTLTNLAHDYVQAQVTNIPSLFSGNISCGALWDVELWCIVGL